MEMPHPPQSSRKASNAEENACLRLIEALAHGDPVPDTSSICAERKELLALLAKISKGERSEFLSAITQVAQARGIPPQEIASRAGFLLACLEAPGDDDYYMILGVPPTATFQEIRRAWVGRLSLYHPDRHPAHGDWFTRQAARLNEAYHTLKDPGRRQAYDEERRREVLARQQRGSSVLQQHPTRQPRAPLLFGGLMRRRLPAVLTGGSVVAAGLVVVFLFVARPAHRLEGTPLSPANTPGPVKEGHSGGKPILHDRRSLRSLTRHPAIMAQALPPVVPEPKGLDRQEIDALLDEYVDAYEKGDLDRLMATLSPKVRERGTLDYQAIRSLYAKGFAGREQIIYRIKNVQVQIKGETATITAQYLISARNATQSQKNVTVSGQIEWKIQREGEKPKIIAINY